MTQDKKSNTSKEITLDEWLALLPEDHSVREEVKILKRAAAIVQTQKPLVKAIASLYRDLEDGKTSPPPNESPSPLEVCATTIEKIKEAAGEIAVSSFRDTETTVWEATRTLIGLTILNDEETWTELEGCVIAFIPEIPAIEEAMDSGQDVRGLMEPIEGILKDYPPSGVFDLEKLITDLPLRHLERYRIK
jgi:hypothetical protein